MTVNIIINLGKKRVIINNVFSKFTNLSSNIFFSLKFLYILLRL